MTPCPAYDQPSTTSILKRTVCTAVKRLLQRRKPKKECKYRRVIHEVQTKETKSHIVEQAMKRRDDWGEIVRARVDSVVDLIAAEAKYHHRCQTKFFTPGGSLETGPRNGRPEDVGRAQAFQKLCDFMESSDECQFSFTELVEKMSSFLENAEADSYCQKYLKEKLSARYGNSVFFTEIPGSPTVVNFSGLASTILYDNWYNEKRSSPTEERMRIVDAAARIILNDIRSTMCETESYPVDVKDLSGSSSVPETLRHFLELLITTKTENKNVVGRKRDAIGEAIMTACRPRSYISPILLGVGVSTHLTGSRELVDMLSSLSFSVSYKEVQRYEYSIIEETPSECQERPADPARFIQYAFDNADFNIKTLTGHGTFHSLGGLRFTTPPPSTAGTQVRRILNPPRSDVIAARGALPIEWYKKPGTGGLKSVTIRELKDITVETARTVKKSRAMDYLWASGHWSGVTTPTSWNGFMRSAVNTGEMYCAVTKEEALPFINLSPSNPSALYTALLFAAKECKRQGQTICFVTLDQPLFWIGSDIVAAAPEGSELDSVVVRLGGFHTLMSFLGAIGFIMSGSGLEELWSLVYAKNSVTHMISGHAYSRALRAHNLTYSALFTLLLEEGSLDHLKTDVKELFLASEKSDVQPLPNDSDDALDELIRSVESLLSELSLKSCTSALFSGYLEMIDTTHDFIRAERMGDWYLHISSMNNMLPYFQSAGHIHYSKSAYLNLQKLKRILSRMSESERSNFLQNGFFTVRRKPDRWNGVWSDMAIEQSLMRPLKSNGGLTRGRGITDSNLARFVFAAPRCLALRTALEQLTGVKGSSSEQHVEMRDSRRKADDRDVAVFLSWLREHSPWDTSSSCLRSLASGVVGDDNINCDKAKLIGTRAVKQMIGCTFGDVKISRKNRVTPLLAVGGTVTVRDEVVPVNTVQLLWRILGVMKSPDELQTYLSYELAPKPPALFEDGFMRKTAKSVLLQKFSHCAPPEILPDDAAVVIDGGYLLRAHRWPRPATYGQILQSYGRYVQRHFPAKKCFVVFDGYDEPLSTKAETHVRRAKTSVDIVFDENTTVTCTQEDFLSNAKNKSKFITKLREVLQKVDVTTYQANGDADTLIVSTAREEDTNCSFVSLVASDTDILVMLIATAREGTAIRLVTPSTSNSPGKMYNIDDIQTSLGDAKSSILFVHAITGCDTTSALKGKGKANPWKMALKDCQVKRLAQVFNNSESSHDDVAAAGEEFIKKLYGCKDNNISVEDLRMQEYRRHVSSQAVTANFDLSVLPPTESACRQHSYRAYHQVQEWLGHSLRPQDWGWRISGRSLMPIPMESPPAPKSLLELISCNCKGDCSRNICECRRSGLPCSRMCKNCFTNNCTNTGVCVDEDDEEDC